MQKPEKFKADPDYDRYLGDYEILRTSTEEPKTQGISYTYEKDVSQYMPLWRQPQKVIFDLPNIIDLERVPPASASPESPICTVTV